MKVLHKFVEMVIRICTRITKRHTWLFRCYSKCPNNKGNNSCSRVAVVLDEHSHCVFANKEESED